MNEKPTILVIDDEDYTLNLFRDLLEGNGCSVLTAKSGEAGLELLEKNIVDIVFLDQRMPGLSGMDTFMALKNKGFNMPVIMMTGYATVSEAVGAMKEGAYDYLTKPFDNLDEIEAVVERALRYRRLEDENRYLKEQLSETFSFEGLIGKSERMKAIIAAIGKIAPLDSTVLITGESGTGKELVARAIHQNSPRKERKFVAVNCAALPDTLLESMLFGFEKGAFTGAARATTGYFEEAHDGTLFLDEVAEMSPKLQGSLLRVIQEKEFSRLGSHKLIKTDFRLITASNKRLDDEIKEGRFREDLFYRLNVVTIQIPPLKERKEDIPVLAGHLLENICKRYGKKIGPFSTEAMDLLINHPWNGNVRELKNTLEAIIAMKSGGGIALADLPSSLREEKVQAQPEVFTPYKESKELFERRYLERALQEAGGSMTKAAEITGIKRQNLYEKLKQYGLR